MTGDRTLSPRGLEAILLEQLARIGRADVSVRVIRLEGARALVEVPHTAAVAARTAWNTTWVGIGGVPFVLTTRSTWGTLVKGKAWLRAGLSA